MSRTLYNELSGVETRLGDKLDKGLNEMKDLIRENKRDTEALEREFDRHVAIPGHPLLVAKVEALEKMVQANAQRPQQVFSTVYQVIYLIFGLTGIILTILSLTHVI